MNVQSTNKGLDDLLYYIVPATWYRNAWQCLLNPQSVIAENWREQVGDLPPVKPWFHDSEQQQGSNDVQQQKANVLKEMQTAWKQPTAAAAAAAANRTEKKHEKDYYFVGQNTWELLANKFGKNSSADAVACHVVSFPSQDSRLAVNLPDGTTRIPIPASGRFAYEKSLNNKDSGDCNETMYTVRHFQIQMGSILLC